MKVSCDCVHRAVETRRSRRLRQAGVQYRSRRYFAFHRQFSTESRRRLSVDLARRTDWRGCRGSKNYTHKPTTNSHTDCRYYVGGKAPSKQVGARPDGRYEMRPSRIITDYRLLSETRSIYADEINVFDNMCRMGRWSFRSWCDINRSTFDKAVVVHAAAAHPKVPSVNSRSSLVSCRSLHFLEHSARRRADCTVCLFLHQSFPDISV